MSLIEDRPSPEQHTHMLQMGSVTGAVPWPFPAEGFHQNWAVVLDEGAAPVGQRSGSKTKSDSKSRLKKKRRASQERKETP